MTKQSTVGKLKHKKKVAVIDLFCGAGGLAFGLKAAGLRVAAGVDLDPHCKYPIEKNTGAKFKLRDIADLTSKDLNKWFGKAEIRVLAGCAPCQPFSTYSQSRKSEDERWSLLQHFQRLVEESLPEIVTMENVVGLGTQPVWADFTESLQRLNYDVSWKTVNCQDYGVPQSRLRLVLLASRLGPIELDAPHDTEPLTVKDAIGDLPVIAAGEVCASDPLHMSATLLPINITRIKASRPGGTWRDWPESLRAKCHMKKSGKTYPSVYGRMEWSKPAPTMTTQCYGFGNGRFGHPDQHRAISLREAALLQSFPHSYSFVSPKDRITFNSIGTLIGNAVPPKLAEAIGRSINCHLSQLSTNSMIASG